MTSIKNYIAIVSEEMGNLGGVKEMNYFCEGDGGGCSLCDAKVHEIQINGLYLSWQEDGN